MPSQSAFSPGRNGLRSGRGGRGAASFFHVNSLHAAQFLFCLTALGLSPLGPQVRSRRLAAPDSLPAGRAGAVRGVARQHAAGARPKRAGSRPRSQPGRLPHPDPHPGRSTGTPPVSAPDGRPAPRPHPGPGLGQGLDRHAPDLPDRGPGLGRRRLPRVAGATGHRGRPAGPAPASEPQPHDPERYPARNAVERGLGWLKGGQRVATRYAQDAHRCLGFLYLAGAWLWTNSKLHRTMRSSLSDVPCVRANDRALPAGRGRAAPAPATGRGRLGRA